jgi:uncharacterized protein YkwD
MLKRLSISTFLTVVLFGLAALVWAGDSKPTDSKATSKATQSDEQKSTESTSKDGPKLYEVEKQLIEQTNAQRAKYGLPPLAVDQSLEKTARSHTVWMTNSRNLQHSNINVGENIAMGQRTTGEAVTDWMNSPGHRANILNSSYKRTGVAAFQTPDGTIYWCQQFLP